MAPLVQGEQEGAAAGQVDEPESFGLVATVLVCRRTDKGFQTMTEDEELAHLRAPSTDPKQQQVDYWGHRAEVAEARLVRLMSGWRCPHGFYEEGCLVCLLAENNALRDALTQSVGWIEECGSDHEGRQFVLTEARAVLRGLKLVNGDV